MIGKKTGRQSFFLTAPRLKSHYRDAKMHLARMRLQRGSNRIKPGNDGRKLFEERFRGLKPRFVELFQDVNVISRVDILDEFIGVIDDLHQPIALLALRSEERRVGKEC